MIANETTVLPKKNQITYNYVNNYMSYHMAFNNKQNAHRKIIYIINVKQFNEKVSVPIYENVGNDKLL